MDNACPLSALDLAQPFMPAHLTPLFHSPVYATLAPAQRLRYNQLQSCCHNEMTMFFELALAHTFMPALLKRREMAAIAGELRQFIAQEDRHIEMFRRLNRRSAPHLYAAGDFHFVRLTGLAAWLLRRVTASPRLFPMFAWLMLIQEERSAFYATEVLQHAAALEPHFVRTHRVHLADETAHVGYDLLIIDALWRPTAPWLRHLNARLFGWMIDNFFSAPRRAAVRVIDQLVVEFPDLEPRKAELVRALQVLSADHDYRRTLYARHMVPKSFAGFDPRCQTTSQMCPWASRSATQAELATRVEMSCRPATKPEQQPGQHYAAQKGSTSCVPHAPLGSVEKRIVEEIC